MKKYFSLFIALAALLQADCGDSSHKRNSWLLPVGRFVVTPNLGESFAVSALAEAGNRDARGSVTLGSQFEFGRFKVTGEYLTQKLTYQFSTGKSHKWVNQGAVGGEYQHLFDGDFLKAVDVKGWYSYAPSKKLHAKECGENLYGRRIAGSNAYSVSGGAVLSPFCEDLLAVDIGYDSVKYRRKYHHDKRVRGVGGGVSYTIRLENSLDLNLKAEFRRPYNYYAAKFTWHRDTNWNVSLFAGYTAGKYHLPRSTTAGLEFAYFFDACGCSQRDPCAPLWSPCDLAGWVAVPAVYLPEVLAIAEEGSLCSGDITSTPIPTQQLSGIFSGPHSFSVVPYFSSSDPITFSATGMPSGMTIDAAGTVSINPGVVEDGEYDITVIGSTPCASSSQPVTVLVQSPA